MLGHADGLVTTRHWLYWPGWEETSLVPFSKRHQDGEQGERMALGGMHLVVKCLLSGQMQLLVDLQGSWQVPLLRGTQQPSCALQQWCAFFFLLLIWLFPYPSPMIPTDKSYHSSVEEQLYIKQGSWKKSKTERRICQCRQTHFCGDRWQVFHKESGAFAALQNSLHVSRWLPKKAPEGLWSQGVHPYDKRRVKLQRLGNAWQKFPQCLWPWPALEVLCQRSQIEFEQSWAETAEQGCPGQTSCLALLAFCDGWGSSMKIRMIRKNNNNKKSNETFHIQKHRPPQYIISYHTISFHIIWYLSYDLSLVISQWWVSQLRLKKFPRISKLKGFTGTCYIPNLPANTHHTAFAFYNLLFLLMLEQKCPGEDRTCPNDNSLNHIKNKQMFR